MKRAQIDVIEVRVAEKDDVDFWQVIDRERGRSHSFRSNGEQKRNPDSDSRKKDGIGQDIDAEEIDEHCGVTKPRRGQARVAPCCRIRFSECRSDRTPAFTYCLAP